MKPRLPLLLAAVILLPLPPAVAQPETPKFTFKPTAPGAKAPGTGQRTAAEARALILKKIKEERNKAKESLIYGFGSDDEWNADGYKVVKALQQTYGNLKASANAGETFNADRLTKLQDLVAKAYGADEAKLAMRVAALGYVDPDWIMVKKMRPSAVDYVAGLGLVPADNEALQSQYPGAKVLDANLNDRLDADDLMILPSGAVSAIGASQLLSLNIADAVVAAAKKMMKNSYRFDPGGGIGFNTQFWKVTKNSDDKPVFTPNDPDNPAAAVQDILDTKGAYAFDCAMSVRILYYIAALKLGNPAAFNKAFGGGLLTVGPGRFEPSFLKMMEPVSGCSASSPKECPDAGPDYVSTLAIGDLTYILNRDVTESAAAGGWSGENVVFLGASRFFAFPAVNGKSQGMEVSEIGQDFRDRSAIRPGGRLPVLVELGYRMKPSFVKSVSSP